jgi:nucleotide-binding universal stress UspA family protein
MITQPVRLQSILVPLDGSELAEQALPIAQAIAERARCKLKLVLVHDRIILKPGPDYTKLELAMQKANREYLKSVTARVRERLGRSVSSAVLQGLPVVETLARYTRELGADLVVMTTHGLGGLRRAWLGSVTDQLIRSAEVPVLVVRPGDTGVVRTVWKPGEILVALDGSPLAEAALEPAIEMARLWDAELSLVQVVSPITPSSGPHLTFPSSYAEQVTALNRESADDYIKDVAEQIRESGVRASGVAVIGGGVPETLIELAEPERVGLMVVATHGLGGVRRMVLGSVADKVVRGANVPVLVVRPTARRARRKSGEVNAAVGAGAPS